MPAIRGLAGQAAESPDNERYRATRLASRRLAVFIAGGAGTFVVSNIRRDSNAVD
jgi:hypothetical protein